MDQTITEGESTFSESIEKIFSIHGIDKDDARILKFTYKSPRTIPTVSTVLGIPIVECYKRARKLRNLGLLNRIRLLSPNSKSESRGKMFYSANSDRVEVVIIRGRPRVHIRISEAPEGSVSQFAIVL
ncbi:MAG: hypothetical protein ACE5KV_04660 [Thermoplasmata archaeon]